MFINTVLLKGQNTTNPNYQKYNWLRFNYINKVYILNNSICRYINSVQSLIIEARLSEDVQVCDNIDLETILLEYYDYYFAKFNKYPKVCKKNETVTNLESILNA